MLLKHHSKPNSFVCAAASNKQNNIARIKLLKEKREMTVRKKLAYALIALTTISIMSWNTLATATGNEEVQQSETDKKQLGVLVDFEATITNKENIENNYRYDVKLWVNFNEKSTFKVGENFTVNLKAKDLGESTFLEYELVESTDSNEKIVSKPSLTVNYGQEATVEIDNPKVSKYVYLIKATYLKVKLVSSSH
jgi:hypothetical protein